jgi:methionyl-tRNA synthetase
MKLLNHDCFYITTSIAYTNSKPHIGYALELVQADVLARFYRQDNKDLFFLTGTDDHGVKIFRSAEEKNIKPQQFVDANINEFKKLIKKLNISNDRFISTSDKKAHWSGAQKLWKKLHENGDIYKKSYEGIYCAGCEAYLTKKDLIDGKCPNHQAKPELIKEENYFFKLTRYRDTIINKIKNNELVIVPEARKNEILNILADLEDVSFSRPREKLSWGVPVPGDDNQVMYVWCDALSNYLTGLGYGQKDESRFKKYWPANIHCIGKDILRFHAAIWPAMLLSAGLRLPKTIFVHGWITSEGQKMSKSLGNVVDPLEIIDKYGADALRYYLLCEIPATGDGDFSQKRFEEVYNGELANELGNLVMRAVKMVKKNKLKLSDYKKAVPIYKSYKMFSDSIGQYNFEFALENIWQRVRLANQTIEMKKPWEIKNKKILNDIFEKIFFQIQTIALSLEPFLPETATEIQQQLKTLKAKPLFPRLN